MKARTNEERADLAARSLEPYDGALHEDETGVTDLLTDLMHLCHREKIDVYRCWSNAQMNFEAECEEEVA